MSKYRLEQRGGWWFIDKADYVGWWILRKKIWLMQSYHWYKEEAEEIIKELRQ